MILKTIYSKLSKCKHCLNLTFFFPHCCVIVRGDAMTALTYAYSDLG